MSARKSSPLDRMAAWLARDPRRKTLLVGGFGAVALAAVIFGLSALSSPNSPEQFPVVAEDSNAEKATKTYDEALRALQSGDTTQAITLLERAVTLDPSNSDAAATLDEVRRSVEQEEPEPDDGSESGSGGGTKTPPPFTAQVKDIGKLLPKAHQDFELGSKIVSGPEAAISGTPVQPGSSIQLLLWSVHDRKTEAKARAFITEVSKSAYGRDKGSVKVDGASAYFGTDGTRFATVVYTRGRYVFEVVATVDGAAPLALKSRVISAAREFPDKP